MAFDSTRPAESTFAPGEGVKDGEFSTFKARELRKVAYNPALHEMEKLKSSALKKAPLRIAYSFPLTRRTDVRSVFGKFSGVRVAYGSDRFTYRQLYDFLCAAFNGGERFVDVYFQSIFPYSAVGRRFKRFEALVFKELRAEGLARYEAALERKQTKSGAPNLTTVEGRALKDFDAWKQVRSGSAVAELLGFAKDIRREIIQCLSTGKIPMNHKNTAGTMELRRLIGLDSSNVFHASGKLIESIEVEISMPEGAFV
jgi:hypothetical protein